MGTTSSYYKYTMLLHIQYVCTTGVWQDFWPIAVFCGCSGFFEGGFHGQRATVLSEMVPPPFLSMSVGYIVFFQGVGNLIAPVWAGQTLACGAAS